MSERFAYVVSDAINIDKSMLCIHFKNSVNKNILHFDLVNVQKPMLFMLKQQHLRFDCKELNIKQKPEVSMVFKEGFLLLCGIGQGNAVHDLLLSSAPDDHVAFSEVDDFIVNDIHHHLLRALVHQVWLC